MRGKGKDMNTWVKGFCFACVLLLAGCVQSQAPSFLLFGSYFPSWLVGVAISIVLTLLVRWGLIRAGIDDVLPMRLLVYVCMGLVLTLAFAYIFSPR